MRATLDALTGRLPAGGPVTSEIRDRALFLICLLAAGRRGVPFLLTPPRRTPGSAPEASPVRVVEGDSDDDGVINIGTAVIAPGGATPDVPINPDQAAAIASTSGSTGVARRYEKHWGGLFAEAAAIGGSLRLGKCGTHMVATVPASHMYGFSYGLIGPQRWGLTLEAQCPVFPRDLARALGAAPGPTWILTTPTHLRAYIESGEPFPNVAGLISSAAPLSADLAQATEERFSRPLIETYGSTETGAIAWRRPTRDELWNRYPGVVISTGGDGMRIRSPWLPATGQRLDDLVEILEGGRFRIIGRTGDLLKVGGKRASLRQLSEILTTLERVEDGAFFLPSPPGSSSGEARPVAFVVCVPEALDGVEKCLRERIDPVFFPRPLLRVARLPRNATGKLPRQALEALWLKHKSNAVGGR